jgi:hypothetical protein
MKHFNATLFAAWLLVTLSASAQDRVDLEGTSIIGNRELPKVLYIVPWKEPDLGDLGELPPTGLLDEVVSPVDREVFQRQLDYYAFIEGSNDGASKPHK